jgi:hypothetical protein
VPGLAGPVRNAGLEVAGILEGTSEGELNEPLARQCARLCRQAGADPEAIPAWIEEGRRRKATRTGRRSQPRATGARATRRACETG